MWPPGHFMAASRAQSCYIKTLSDRTTSRVVRSSCKSLTLIPPSVLQRALGSKAGMSPAEKDLFYRGEWILWLGQFIYTFTVDQGSPTGGLWAASSTGQVKVRAPGSCLFIPSAAAVVPEVSGAGQYRRRGPGKLAACTVGQAGAGTLAAGKLESPARVPKPHRLGHHPQYTNNSSDWLHVV